MKSTMRLVLGIGFVFALCLGAFADADKTTGSAIKSDGSLLDEQFTSPSIPKGWIIPVAGNRHDISFKDGCCIFNPGKGDNNIIMPTLPINLTEDFVLEITFSVPAPVVGTFSVMDMKRDGGDLMLVVNAAGATQNVMLGRTKLLSAIEPGKTYTVAMQCKPDGTCLGVLTGPGIETPAVQTFNGSNGPLRGIVLGNVFGAGEGSMSID